MMEAFPGMELDSPAATPSADIASDDRAIVWSADTDSLFYERGPDVLPNEYPRLLSRLLRQKLAHVIKARIGPQVIIPTARGKPNPYVSDRSEPNYYEWRFSPRYPGFPERKTSAWTMAQVRECNQALEYADFYVIDVRNPDAKPPPKQGRKSLVATAPQTSTNGPINGQSSQDPQLHGQDDGQNGVRGPGSDRKRLVAVTEAAMRRHIREATKIREFSFRDVITGDGSMALPGWRWRFPTNGYLMSFPLMNNLWSWSTESLLAALNGLLTKSLRLEAVDGYQARAPEAPRVSVQASPELDLAALAQEVIVNSYKRPINLESPEPEPWGAQVQAVANQTSSFPLPDEPGFDDLLGQLAQCSQQWREDRRQLEINIREMDLLRKMNREQTVKIQSMQSAMKNLQGVVQTFGTQEQANKTNGNASAMSPAAVNGMEAYYSGEFRKAQATINNLKNVIKQHEAAAQDSNGLRERNQTLEAQLAEKTAEAVSAHETLATLTGAPKPKKPKPYSSQNRSANQTPAQPYNKSLNNPTWRAKPSRSNNTRQNTNSTDTPRLPLHRPDITSRLYSGSNATTTFSPNVNINAAIESARQTIENTNDFLRNGQVMYSSPYSLAQAGTLQPGQYASTAPVMGRTHQGSAGGTPVSNVGSGYGQKW